MKKRVYKNAHKIKIELLSLMGDVKFNRPLPKQKVKKLAKIMSNKDYRSIVLKHMTDIEDRVYISKLIEQTNLLKPILKNKDADYLDKAYKVYLIGEFKMDKYYYMLVEGCKDSSMYVQINAIRALSIIGDVDYFVKGLQAITQSSTLIHDKVIIDCIYHFSGNKVLLNKVLSEMIINIKDNDKFSHIVLDFFTTIKYENIQSVICKLLNNNILEKEIKISAVKYIMTIHNDEIKNLLFKLIDDESWEIRSLSATALRKYNDKEAIVLLKKAIKDSVWYVRQSAARSLYQLCDEQELMTIVDSDDKYASDAILSILSDQDKFVEYSSNKRVS